MEYLHSLIPIVSLVKFAELSGVPVNVVRGWADKGLVPTRKIGRRRVVDLVALAGKLGESK